MKKLILAASLIAMAAPAAFAQGQEAPQAGATPTCAEALPQIQQLVGQAESSGLETTGAKSHVGEAEAAQARSDEAGCINALVLAQNTILEQVQPPS